MTYYPCSLLIKQSPSIKRHSLSTGPLKTALLVRTLTRGTKPLPSGKVSTILPNGQEFRCEDSVATRTTSPTAKFLWGHTHFCLSCKRGSIPCSIFSRRYPQDIVFASTYDSKMNLPSWIDQVAKWLLTWATTGGSVSGAPYRLDHWTQVWWADCSWCSLFHTFIYSFIHSLFAIYTKFYNARWK